ncbi:hypothetical protein ABT084_05720 [Streptomyces sp. NPDC002138]|uniref:hypothetical protein n=1 Tax=Streptomyces sp. NPDC002138 TaxID=3154410 RepID=UPI0033243F3D
MSMRHAVQARGGAAVVTAVALALTLAGCGGGDDKPKESQKSSVASPGGSPQASAPSGGQSSAPPQVLATVNGPSSTVLTINSVARDQAGFLTVNGQIKNGGSEAFVETAAWRGDERSASAASVAGVTLVDKAGKKRYYVLRDTEGRCLCTIGLTRIGAGESVPFFAQFPAPPANVTDVDFNLPTFATATIKISG